MTVRAVAPVRSAPLGFVSPLDVRLISESPRRWRLLSPLIYRSQAFKLDNPGRKTRPREMARDLLIVPPGLETDFASVPRLPFVWWFAGDRALMPAALHDWLYTLQPCDRGQADAIFREAMDLSGVNALLRRLMWRGVRLGGQARWDAVTAEARAGAAELLRAWCEDVARGPAAA